MKTATLPAVRVAPQVRELIESVLHEGESLSTFIEETVKKHAQWRKEDEAFYARAAKASQNLRDGGKFFTAEESISRLRAQVQRARDRQTTGLSPTNSKPAKAAARTRRARAVEA